MATINTRFGKIEYTSEVGNHSTFYVDGTLWEKGEECRVYFSVKHSKGREQCGYYDCKRKQACIKSSPASWGHEIKASIVHQDSPVYNTGLGFYGTAADAARGFDGIE